MAVAVNVRVDRDVLASENDLKQKKQKNVLNGLLIDNRSLQNITIGSHKAELRMIFRSIFSIQT